MPYSTVPAFQEFHDPAKGQNAVKLATLLDIAGWEVEKYAPPPDPVTVDYTDRALSCELLVAAYLFDTGGYRSNTGSLGKLGSRSFNVEGKAVREIVKSAMGSFYKGNAIRLRNIVRG